MKFVRTTLRFCEDPVWKFVESALTWLSTDYVRVNDRQKFIVRVKISQQCEIKFFRARFRFEESEV